MIGAQAARKCINLVFSDRQQTVTWLISAWRAWMPRKLGAGRVTAEGNKLLPLAQHLDFASVRLSVATASKAALPRFTLGRAIQRQRTG